MRTSHLKVMATAALVTLSFAVTSCGGGKSVEGHTYADNGGVVKIEFESGGKAYVSAGPMTQTCTYTESGKRVTLACPEDKTVFAVGDDGALSGPSDGLLTRLTRQK